MGYRIYLLLLSLVTSLGIMGHPVWQSSPASYVGPLEITITSFSSSVKESVVTPSAANSSTPTSISDEEYIAIAKKAYVWGWPLVYLHNCRNTLQHLSFPAKSGGVPVAPVNQLCMLTEFISPQSTGVPCPNQDVIYGFGILDLEQDAVVLQVPDFGDRFWLFQLGDHRTDGFARLGKMYNSRPGLYLVVGPHWNGEVPPGIIDIFRCPTNIGFCIPRIHAGDSTEITPELSRIVDQIVAYPLQEFTGEWRSVNWRKTRWLPKLGSGRRHRAKFVSPNTFFENLADVITALPPQPGEEAWYREVIQLLQLAHEDPHYQVLLDQVSRDSESEIMAPLFDFRNVGSELPYYWTSIENGAAFGRDFLTRASVAKSNIFVNRREETLYYYQDFDERGKQLTGARSYSITFPAAQLPAVQGFWSLTVYNEDHAFHVNEQNRYSLGSHSRNLRYNDDGSLTLYFQATPPALEQQSNWLPIPPGQFSLYLRAYWPTDSMLRGNWCPPPVTPCHGPAFSRLASE